MQTTNNGFQALSDGGSGSPLPQNIPGGGDFGSLFGNTNAAGGSLPTVDAPGPAQREGGGFPPLPSPTGDGSGGGVPSFAPVTSPVGPSSSLSPSLTDIGHNFGSVGTLDPGLTQQLFSFLQNHIGQGATPFSQTTTLPGGGTTGAGDLTAPLNSLMQQLQSFYSGGATNAPGLNQLNSFATNGQPVDQTPAWQAMVDSMQRNIGQNQANLKEQFNFTGNLAGSPMGTAMSDYMSQTSKDENAQLLAAQTQAMENAKGRQLGASEGLLGANQAFSTQMQGLDQNAINAKLQEFLRTQPEYSPLLNMQYGAGTTFPPIANFNSGIGILGSLLQNAGGLASLIKAIPGLGGSGGGGGGISGIPGLPGAPGGSGLPGTPGDGTSVTGGINPNTGMPNNHPSGVSGGYTRDPTTGLMVPNTTIAGQFGQGIDSFNSLTDLINSLLGPLGGNSLGGGSPLPTGSGDDGGDFGNFEGGFGFTGGSGGDGDFSGDGG